MTDVLEERRLAKQIRNRYHETAKRKYQDVGSVDSDYIKIPDRANVTVVEGGAFVEAVIWIPEADV